MVLGLRRFFKRDTTRTYPGYVRVDPSASVDFRVSFRPNENGTIEIGPKAVIWRGCELCGAVKIGPGVFLNRDVYVRPNTTLEQDVSVGPFACFLTDSHELSDVRKRAGKGTCEPIHVGRGAWIGAGAIVLPGVRVGAGAVVAAGSVVVRDVDPDTLVAGVPAKLVRTLNPLQVSAE